tara:strand:+ start:505 stop:642 length:138 start_codon:yes stop_codon:yes gene_type:complete
MEINEMTRNKYLFLIVILIIIILAIVLPVALVDTSDDDVNSCGCN